MSQVDRLTYTYSKEMGTHQSALMYRGQQIDNSAHLAVSLTQPGAAQESRCRRA